MDKNMENQNIKRRCTFAVLFYINRTKVRKDGMCQLLCKVSIDAEWAQIGTKVSVNPSIWNPDKGRADGRSENAVTVNRAIDDLTDEITGHYDRIKNSLGFITAELVKNAVKGIGQKPLTGVIGGIVFVMTGMEHDGDNACFLFFGQSFVFAYNIAVGKEVVPYLQIVIFVNRRCSVHLIGLV